MSFKIKNNNIEMSANSRSSSIENSNSSVDMLNLINTAGFSLYKTVIPLII